MELVASPIFEAQASLGEGPVWDGQKSVLYWLDINNNKLCTFDPQSAKNTFIDLGVKPGCLVPRASGGLVVALPKAIVAIDRLESAPRPGPGSAPGSEQGTAQESGQEPGKDRAVSSPDSYAVLATLEKDLPNRMNDGKCDPAGRFWCGSMNLLEKNPTANLWMMEKDHSLHKKIADVTISNGLAWTADTRTMYYIDTINGRVDAFDYDIEDGALSNRRTAFENRWGGHFDGMTIDADDHLYIAIWGGGHILKIDPKKGELIYKIIVPGVKNVTCCTFGGRDLKELFITSSAAGSEYHEEPHAGALFHIELPGSQGLPPYEFAG
ncbi:MAG: SMP-30/gluconolactonase/LRE family protein [Cyanobacteria bacterium REEB67]|nr:SMP-30/gluconolactonase/LRE family protein [Cyanobacteria bacterium REEB67]